MDEGLLAAAWVRNVGEGFFIGSLTAASTNPPQHE